MIYFCKSCNAEIKNSLTASSLVHCWRCQGTSFSSLPLGEQNAEPAVIPSGDASALTVTPSQPQVSAPDVAVMIKRLRAIGTGYEQNIAQIVHACAEAAALIEKLGQGWIPALESESKGVFLTGVPGKPIYAVDERAEPYCWWRFDLPDLPPPPERPFLTDAELADEIERKAAIGDGHVALTNEKWAIVIAALRRQPSSDQVLAQSQARVAELEKALHGVLTEADRDTDAFIFARVALKDRA